jgi:ABC-type oligopeptide transport system substrate-binding subunit
VEHLTKILFSAVSFVSVSASASQSKSFVVSVNGSIGSLDPSVSVERYSQFAILQVFDSLFTQVDGMAAEPNLVESYTYNPAELEYKFRLKRGIKFHSGAALTNKDVLFTFRHMCDRNKLELKIKPLIKGCTDKKEPFGVKAHGDLDFSVALKSPYPPFLTGLSSVEFSILPKDFAGFAEKKFIDNPIGTGPFRFLSRSKTALHFESNKNYHGRVSPFDSMEIKTLEASDLEANLKSKSIDLALGGFDGKAPAPEGYALEPLPTIGVLFLQIFSKTKMFDTSEKRRCFLSKTYGAWEQLVLSQTAALSGAFPARAILPWGVLGFQIGTESVGKNPPSAKCATEPAKLSVAMVGPTVKEYLSQGKIRLAESLREHKIDSKVTEIGIREFIEKQKDSSFDAAIISLSLSDTDPRSLLMFWSNASAAAQLGVGSAKYESLLSSALIEGNTRKRAVLYSVADKYLVEHGFVRPMLHILKLPALRKKDIEVDGIGILGPYFSRLNEVRRAPSK